MSNGNFNPGDSKGETADSGNPASSTQGSPNPIKPADPKDKPTNHKKARLFIRIWRIHRRRQQKVSPPNVAEWISVFLILVAAAIGGVQARIYYQQKKIMESSSGQTNQLITAANIQACAAQKIADASNRNTAAAQQSANAADRFATSADGINTKTADAVESFSRMAKASEDSIKATQDAIRLDQRAWVAGAVLDQPDGTYAIRFVNSGKTPAIKVLGPSFMLDANVDSPTPFSKLKQRNPPPPANMPPFIREQIEKAQIESDQEKAKKEGRVLAPQSYYTTALPVHFGAAPPITAPAPGQQISDIRKKNFIQGYVTYEDVFKQPHETWFCYFQFVRGGGVQMCDTDNGMN